MKAFVVLPAVLAVVLAAPSTPATSIHLEARTLGLLSKLLTPKCPSNKAQPDGKLPSNSVSTSALVPISAKNPNTAYPNSEWAKITPGDFCTVFNLVVDSDATQGKVCNLVFDFPDYLQAPGDFVFLGSGKFTFTGYDINAGAVPGETTYANQPRPGPSPPYPPPVMKPGNSYIVNSAPCGIPPGIGPVTVSGSLCSKDTTFLFKQSRKVCPLGFYVVLTEDSGAGSPH
ncbi:gpi anchored cell wall protein [Stagonosporopsis vannaccii]|nr:gpi anchored cell wall protein [Stagonosporopsis vannaccii]